jgi:hypothetical protein
MTNPGDKVWRYPVWLRGFLIAAGSLLIASSAWVGTPGWTGWFERAGVAFGPFVILEGLLSRASMSKESIRVRNCIGRVKEVRYDSIASITLGGRSTLTIEGRDGTSLHIPRMLGDSSEIVATLKHELGSRGRALEDLVVTE